MTDEAIKKRIERAKKRAIEHFKKTGYHIVESNNINFCFIASRKREIRFIRVVIDKITEEDVKKIKEVELPEYCTREIYCENKDNFEIKEIEGGKT